MAFEVVLEKGEGLPIEKTFRLRAGNTLGPQDKVYLEFFEIPERLLTRRWINESGMEFIKQTLKGPDVEASLKALKIIPLSPNINGAPIDEDIMLTMLVDEAGNLSLRHGETMIETEIRLQ